MRETLSPMPPVECLSTFGRLMAEVSTRSPERIMASVSTAISFGFMPRRKMAMAMADIW
jgi:hypothetical protein